MQFAAHKLSLLPQQPARSVLNGRHASRLRGRGLNFEEMRSYVPGDDVRSIDWKTTARLNKPFVRVLTEERDRPVLLVVDQRMSMFFGSELNMKSVTAAESAALALFITLHQGDRIGTLLFDDDETHIIKPMRSARTANRIISRLSAMNQALSADRKIKGIRVSLNDVLGKAAELAHHDHLLIVISDFDGIDDTTHKHLSTLAQHNDLILMLVYDPIARTMSSRRLVVSDGNLQAQLDLGKEATRHSVEQLLTNRLDQIIEWQQQINLSVFPISAAENTLQQVRQLLSRGAPRRRIR
jgi:uncharacterized protein (DUF58 family)